MKKIGSIIISFLVMICYLQLNTLIKPTYAESIGVEQKADVLNKLYVLTGDGTSYNLSGKLKRSEASTFIVKVMGMQNKVLQQKALYSTTSFKDVPPSEWYAPYVGYMIQQGIITGYPDGTFKPNEYISEKAFFSMVLKAMGYTGTDYDWNTVNKLAFEVGLTEDIMYVFKEDDKTNYLRSDVINTLYNALSKSMKGKEKRFIELLIDNGMVSSSLAETYGFIKIDKLQTAIVSTKALSDTSLQINFNEDIIQPDIKQIIVYDKINTNKQLKVISLSYQGNVLTVNMEPQISKQNYVMEFTNILDKQNNNTTNLKAEFSGYSVAEIASPYFKISKVEGISEKSVNIYFTHPVNDKADQELLYDFYSGDSKWIEGNYKTITVKRNDNRKNMITITLKEASFTPGNIYTIKVKGDLRSTYGVNLNKGNGEGMNFVAINGTPVLATLKNAYSQEGTYIFLEYSQVVDKISAVLPTNYSIREVDTNRSIPVIQVYAMKNPDMSEKGFVLKAPGLVNNKIYELTVKGVYDTYRISQLTQQKIEFMGAISSSDGLKVESATAIDKYTIAVAFNRELKESSSNATLSIEGGPVAVRKQVEESDPRILKLFLSSSTPLQSGKVYSMRFYNGVLDFMDRSISSSGVTVDFVGSSAPKPSIGVESAYFADETTIMLKYNQPVHPTLGANVNKYDLYVNMGGTERLIIPTSVDLVSDTVVLIKVPLIASGGSYRLQIREMLEVSGQFSTPLLSIEVK